MKIFSSFGLWTGKSLAIAVSALALSTLPVPAQEPAPAMERAESLERRAQQLRAQGEQDRAEALMREAQQLRRRGESREPRERRGDVPRQEIERQLEQVRAEIAELRADGKEERAVEAQRAVQALEQRLARFARTERPQREPGERIGREVPRSGNGLIEPRQRLRHLEIAIDNLRAAGMPEVAERLEKQAESMRRGGPGQMGMQPAPRPGPGVPGPEFQRLQAEVRELRQAVRELNARLEESRRN